MLLAWSPALLLAAYALIGVLFGRRYLEGKPSEAKLQSYLDSANALVTLAGLLVAAISLVVSIQLNNLPAVSAVLTYLSAAFVLAILGAYTVKTFEDRNLYYYFADAAEYSAILSLGLGFFYFFSERLPGSIAWTFGILVVGVVLIALANLRDYMLSWKPAGGAG